MKIHLLLLLIVCAGAQAQNVQPTATEAKVNVIVTNTKGEPSPGDLITFTSKSNAKSFSGTTGAEGTFSLLVPKNDKYEIKYRGFGSDENYSEVEIPAFDGLLNFDVKIIYELPKTYTLDNVYFDTGRSTLKPGSYKALNNLSELMLSKKSLKIEIAGHTDNVGDRASNQKLSEDRAGAVRSYLLGKGVPAARVTAKGYGDTRPVASNDTDDGKSKNRRTEVHILEQ